MKKYLLFAIMCLAGMAVKAQDHTMLVHLKNGNAPQFNTQQVDSVVCDSLQVGNEKRVVIYVYKKGSNIPEQYMPDDVERITWFVADKPDDTIEKNGVTLTNPETFTMNEETMEVKGDNCSVTLFPTAVEEDKRLVIRESAGEQTITIANEEAEGGQSVLTDNAKVVDIDLEGIHELDGAARIRIPFEVADDELPGAAYYNQETGEWEPVNSYYDKSTGEVVILTTHFSMFGTFKVKKEHTHAAYLSFYTIPIDDASDTELRDILVSAAKGVTDWVSWNAEAYGTLSIAKDLGFTFLGTAGFDEKLLKDCNKTLGNIAVGFSVFEICRSAFFGDDKKLAQESLKLVASKLTNGATSLLVDAVGSAVGFSTAFIDYALTKFAEEAWRGRNDIYWRAYRAYYSKRAIPGLANAYRSSPQWYQLLYPIFEKPNQTSEEIKAQIDQIVDDYTQEFWRDENLIVDYFYEVSGLPYSQGGGLNQRLKDEISSTFKQEILGDILPGVFQSISDKLYDKQYARVRNELVKYAKTMNQIIALQFKDGQITGEKSRYAGCTVRFKNLPNTITDPEKWQCVLTDQGTGVIRFRLYPYTFEGVKPMMEVVDAEGKVVKQLAIAISTDPGRTIIDLNENNLKGFVLQSFNKEEVEYKHDSPILPPLVNSETGTPYVNVYTTYQGEQTEIVGLPLDPSVFDKGIKEAFEMYGNFEFNPNGTIKVDNNVLTVDGSFQLEAMQQRPQKGSGTFSVNYSNLVNRKTTDEVSAWWQNPDMSKIMLMWDAVLNATVKHTISGTFTFEWNNDKQGYVFQFKGKGNYDIAGQVYNWVSNVNPEKGGYGSANPGAQVTHTEGFTLKGKSDMDFEMTYKLVE